MAAANISINGGSNGVGTLAAPLNALVTLTDVGGGSPQTRTWSITRWPAPLTAPPALATPTASSSSFTPTTDGIYVVTLVRLESNGATTTTMSLLVGVPDQNGNILPSPGVDETLFALLPGTPQQQAAAKLAGWSGSAAGGTNVLLDAYLRQSSPTTKSINGVGTVSASTVSGNDVAVVMPCSPLGSCDCACTDGANLWVGDGAPTSGVAQVYKTNGSTLLGVYALPTDAVNVEAIASDGVHVFVLVTPGSTTDCLYVLDLNGNTVGVGQFPAAQNGGELVVQGGYCWCQDNANGLVGFSIPTLLANGTGTPTPPGKTLSATSGGSNNGITTDGTNLYCTNGTTVWQIAPGGPSITTSVVPAFGQVNGVFHSSVGPGSRIYCGVYTSPSTNEVLVLTTSLATAATFTPTSAGTSSAPSINVSADDGTYLYMSAGDGVSIVDPSTFTTLRADFAPDFLGGAFPTCSVGSTVWVLVQGLNGLSGIQAWTTSGPQQLFIGPPALQYAPALPGVSIAADYDLSPAWTLEVQNPEDGTTSAGALVAVDLTSGESVPRFGLGHGWLDFLAEVSTSAVGTPAANTIRIFLDTADGKLKTINPSAAVTQLGGISPPAGDIGGTITNPTIAKLQGTTLTLTSPANGQFVGVSTGAFKNVAITGDVFISSTFVATVSQVQGQSFAAASAAGQVAMSSGSGPYSWTPVTLGPSRFGDFGSFSNALTTPQTIRYFDFNPAAFPSAGLSMTVKVEMVVPSASDTCVVALWDATDGVQIVSLTASSTTPQTKTATLTLGTPGTNVIANGNRTYYWTVARSGGSAADSVVALGGYIEAQN